MCIRDRNVLERWTEQWLVKVNTKKTTFTIFSLSPKEQKVTLRISGHTLLAEDNPTYLGVTFDKRLIWKKQTGNAESRGKARLALMKKLAGLTRRGRCQNTQVTVHWKSQASARERNECMGHSGQVQL